MRHGLDKHGQMLPLVASHNPIEVSLVPFTYHHYFLWLSLAGFVIIGHVFTYDHLLQYADRFVLPKITLQVKMGVAKNNGSTDKGTHETEWVRILYKRRWFPLFIIWLRSWFQYVTIGFLKQIQLYSFLFCSKTKLGRWVYVCFLLIYNSKKEAFANILDVWRKTVIHLQRQWKKATLKKEEILSSAPQPIEGTFLSRCCSCLIWYRNSQTFATWVKWCFLINVMAGTFDIFILKKMSSNDQRCETTPCRNAAIRRPSRLYLKLLLFLKI